MRNNSETQNRLKLHSQSGFTLVELLIVIVIIGILAGVVIGVLNPVQQQNRARDGATRAQIDKMALSNKSLYVSSPRTTQRSPTLAEFAGGIASSADVATNCASNSTAATESCLFQITGQPLATNCTAALIFGSGNPAAPGASQCSYAYWRAPTEFKIAAHGAAKPNTMFVYSYIENASTGNVNEGFYSCADNYDPRVAGVPVGCTQIN